MMRLDWEKCFGNKNNIFLFDKYILYDTMTQVIFIKPV